MVTADADGTRGVARVMHEVLGGECDLAHQQLARAMHAARGLDELLSTQQGAVASATFINFVRRAVDEGWWDGDADEQPQPVPSPNLPVAATRRLQATTLGCPDRTASWLSSSAGSDSPSSESPS